jgi:hypothetical protein
MQGQGRGYELSTGIIYQGSKHENAILSDSGMYKLFGERVMPGWGAQIDFKVGIPILEKLNFKGGLLVAYSTLRQELDSDLKFGTGGHNGQFYRYSLLKTRIRFFEIGVPLSINYILGRSELGLLSEFRYVIAPAVNYTFYEGGVKTDRVTIPVDKDNFDSKNIALGFSFENYPFRQKNFNKLGWGIDAVYFILKNRLYLTENPVNRINLKLYAIYSLK